MTGVWSEPVAESIARLVEERTGFTYAVQHPSKTEEGIRRAMDARGTACMRSYLRLLQSDADAMDQLVDELTIRETYFFREPRHFDFVRERVVPSLCRTRGGDLMLRAWSAGCASGEEAYSLAILLEQVGLGRSASVLGTDISQAALATARAGRFRDWSLRGAGPSFLSQYFHPSGPAWQLVDSIRGRVRFSLLNLALDAYPSHVSGTHGIDVIFCRNVLIYLDAWVVDAVIRRLAAALTPGGWLITASSDPAPGRDSGLVTHVTEYGVFHQRPVENAVLPTRRVPEQAQEPPSLRPGAVPTGQHPRRLEEDDELEIRCARAEDALGQGDYQAVLDWLPDLSGGSNACRLRIDALANQQGPETAVQAAEMALKRHPLATELHFRHAVLLSSLGRLDAAEEALRRVIYLDRALAVAHFALGALHWRRRRPEAARRSYDTAARLSRALDPEVELPLAEGQTAGALATAAQRLLSALGGPEEAIPA